MPQNVPFRDRQWRWHIRIGRWFSFYLTIPQLWGQR